MRARQRWREQAGRRVQQLPTGWEPGEEVAGWVTQLGGPARFQEAPRFARPEFDVSVSLGTLSVDEATRLCFRRPARPKDCVRHLHADDLRSAGYSCQASPSSNNPEHVSIVAPLDEADLAAHEGWWANPERVTLDNIAVISARRQEGGP